MKVVHGTRKDDQIGDNAMPDAPHGDQFYFGHMGDDTIVTAGGDDHLSGGKGKDHFMSLSEDSFVIHGGKGMDTAEIWIPSDFDITDIHKNGRNLVDYMEIHHGDQTIRIYDVELFVWHHEELLG